MEKPPNPVKRIGKKEATLFSGTFCYGSRGFNGCVESVGVILTVGVWLL